MYTDTATKGGPKGGPSGYEAYGAFFASWQHCLCEKFDGGTTTVEGVNH